MKQKLTSKYYLIRIAKSKDFTDLFDACSKYAEFKRVQREYAIQHYCQSVRKFDGFGMMEACLIPSY